MKNPPIAHGARNIASVLPVNSWTTNVPLTEARGRQMPRTPATRPRWAHRNLVGQHGDQHSQQRVEEHLGDAPPEQDDGDVGRQRDDEDPGGATQQPDDHPGSSHAQPRRGAVAELAEERVADHGEQGADTGDQREAVRCALDAHQRVDLQRQRDRAGAPGRAGRCSCRPACRGRRKPGRRGALQVVRDRGRPLLRWHRAWALLREAPIMAPTTPGTCRRTSEPCDTPTPAGVSRGCDVPRPTSPSDQARSPCHALAPAAG